MERARMTCFTDAGGLFVHEHTADVLVAGVDLVIAAYGRSVGTPEARIRRRGQA